MTLEVVITGLAGGTLSYPALRLIFNSLLPAWDISLSKAQKRIWSLLVSFALAILALATGQAMGYIEISSEVVWTAMSSAFVASQTFHAGELMLNQRGS